MAMQSGDNSRSSSQYCNRVKEGSWGMEEGWHQYPLIHSWYEAYMCIFHTIPFIPWPRLSQLNQKLILAFGRCWKALIMTCFTTPTCHWNHSNIHQYPSALPSFHWEASLALQVGLWMILYCSSIERPALHFCVYLKHWHAQLIKSLWAVADVAYSNGSTVWTFHCMRVYSAKNSDRQIKNSPIPTESQVAKFNTR